MRSENIKTINLKIDRETKKKFETLAYLQDMKLQDSIMQLIKEAIDKNKDVIAEVEKVRNNFKK